MKRATYAYKISVDNFFVSHASTRVESKGEKSCRDLHQTIFIDQSDLRTNVPDVFSEDKHPDTRIDLIVTEKMRV